jgi:hypothetical protein
LIELPRAHPRHHSSLPLWAQPVLGRAMPSYFFRFLGRLALTLFAHSGFVLFLLG